MLEFGVFSMLLCWKTYVLEKLLGNILLLRENAGKTFTESCNNPVRKTNKANNNNNNNDNNNSETIKTFFLKNIFPLGRFLPW